MFKTDSRISKLLRNSLVSIETILGAGHSGVRTVARLREFSLLQDVNSGCEDQNPPIELLLGVLSRG
jgi:hypothetical protein